MQLTGLESIILRNNFYFKNYRRLLLVNILLFLIIIGLSFFIKYQHNSRPTPKYFPTTNNGYYIQDTDVSKPHKSDDDVIKWVIEIMPKLHSFDFTNFKQVLNNEIRPYFLGDGHAKYLKAMLSSNNLTTITRLNAVVSTTVVGLPKVIEKGVTAGRFSWRIEVPIRIRYEGYKPNANKSTVISDARSIASVWVFRESTLKASSGLAMYQVIL